MSESRSRFFEKKSLAQHTQTSILQVLLQRTVDLKQQQVQPPHLLEISVLQDLLAHPRGEKEMESIMSAHGTALRLVYPRDALYIKLLPEDKCQKVVTVSVLKAAIKGHESSRHSTAMVDFFVTMGTKLTRLKNLVIQPGHTNRADGACVVPIKALASVFALRAHTLEYFDFATLRFCRGSITGTQADFQAAMDQLAATRRLQKIAFVDARPSVMANSNFEPSILLNAMNRIETLNDAAIDLSSYKERHHSNPKTMSSALRHFCSNQSGSRRKLTLRVLTPSNTFLHDVFATNSRLNKVVLRHVPDINGAIDTIIQGLQVSQTMNELKITSALTIASVIKLLGGVKSVPWLKTLKLRLNCTLASDLCLGPQLSLAIQNLLYLQKVNIIITGAKHISLLPFILRGLAENLVLTEAFIEPPRWTAAWVPDYDDQETFFARVDHCYGRARENALLEASMKFELALAKRKTRLNRFDVKPRHENKSFPMLSYKGNFLLKMNTELMDKPSDANLWVDFLIDHKDDPCLSCHVLLADPSMFVPHLQAYVALDADDNPRSKKKQKRRKLDPRGA